jgi:hypothetical protein
MVHNGKSQWPCYAFTAYLALALIGTFTFSTAENLRFEEPGKNQLSSGGSFTAASHTFDWLIEDPKTAGKAYGHQNSLLRNGILRVFLSEEIQTSALYPAGLLLQTVRNNPPPIETTAVPLKLRI